MKEDEYRFQKRLYEDSIRNLNTFCQSSYIVGIEYELESIRKFYKAKLYDLTKER